MSAGADYKLLGEGMSGMELRVEQQDVLQLLAWLHLRCGQPGRAALLLEPLLRAALACHPARRMMAVAALELGDWAETERQCLVLQEEGERRGGVLLCLSRAQQMGGRLEEARATYNSYLNWRNANE